MKCPLNVVYKTQDKSCYDSEVSLND